MEILRPDPPDPAGPYGHFICYEQLVIVEREGSSWVTTLCSADTSGPHRTNMPRLTTPNIVHLNDFRGLGFGSSTLRMRAGHALP